MAFIIGEIFIFIFIFFLRIIYKKEGLVILEWLIRNYMHCIHVFGIRSTVQVKAFQVAPVCTRKFLSMGLAVRYIKLCLICILLSNS